MSHEDFMNLARQDQNWGPTFAMTVLALRLSNYHNGVSKLHGHVARGMWNWLYPGKSQDEVPIGYVTNGVHSASWLASEMRALFDSYLPKNWEDEIDNPETWKGIANIADNVLWETRNTLRARLIEFIYERTRQRLQRIDPNAHIPPMLDKNALTIGFARRFATYKRATLMFKDPERLKAILNRHDRPVQIVFSGKAHPADNPGKHFIQDIYQLSQQPGFAGKIVFVEEYDIAVGRLMVQGVDVWLNNPRRPHEASGTSGQKASLNGAPNASILDGWWPEGFNGKNGWAIGEEREYHNQEEQDWNDAQSLYHVLEHEIVPAFYDHRDSNGVPGRWMEITKEAIITCAPQFSMRRMLADYMSQYYVPAMQQKQK
jgi:starch phosphorylase